MAKDVHPQDVSCIFQHKIFISNHNDIGLQVKTEKGKNLKVEVHSISFHGKMKD